MSLDSGDDEDLRRNMFDSDGKSSDDRLNKQHSDSNSDSEPVPCISISKITEHNCYFTQIRQTVQMVWVFLNK